MFVLQPHSPEKQHNQVERQISIKVIRELVAHKTHIDLDVFFRSPSPDMRSTVTKRLMFSLPVSPTDEDLRLPPLPSSKSPPPERSLSVAEQFDPRIVNRSKQPKVKKVIKELRNMQTYLPLIRPSLSPLPTVTRKKLGLHRRGKSYGLSPSKDNLQGVSELR